LAAGILVHGDWPLATGNWQLFLPIKATCQSGIRRRRVTRNYPHLPAFDGLGIELPKVGKDAASSPNEPNPRGKPFIPRNAAKIRARNKMPQRGAWGSRKSGWGSSYGLTFFFDIRSWRSSADALRLFENQISDCPIRNA
jgi:hypothetical protein